MASRLSWKHCEWLLHPKVAASEFADTIDANLEFLANSESKCIKTKPFSQMQENLAPFLEALRKFNTLKSDAIPTPDNVKAIMKTMLPDDN